MLKHLFKQKKVILIGIIVFVALFVVVSQIQAVTLEVGLDYAKGTGLGTQDIRVTIAKIIQYALGFLGIVALLIVLYAGWLYLTSAGEAEKIDKAKKTMVSGIIGLVIILSSFAIANFVLNSLLQATGVQTRACNECQTGETQACAAGADGCSYINRCQNTCWTGCQKADPSCPYPPDLTLCPNPDPLDGGKPWLCIARPQNDQYQPDMGLTIYGGNIADNPAIKRLIAKDTGGQEYVLEVLTCRDADPKWFTSLPNTTLKSLVVKLPKELVVSGNPYRVIAEFDDKSTNDKNWGIATRGDEFNLTSNVLSTNPILVCMLDGADSATANISHSASKADQRWVKGQRFGTDAGTVGYAGINALVSGTWTDELVETTVPLTISGNVILKNSNSQYSNSWRMNILCSPSTADDDCNSGCCKGDGSQHICKADSFCKGGVGQKCFGSCTDTGCQIGLYCDSDCNCQSRGFGARCDSDLNTPDVCDADNTLCGDSKAYYCSPTLGCSCNDLPRIDDVVYPNGAPGNFVTIYGKGFGSVKNAQTKVYLVSLTTPPVETAVTLPNCDGQEVWSNEQVIFEVPQLALASYKIKLVNSDGLAAEWKYFEINNVVRPSLCSIDPLSGFIGDKVSVFGKNFTNTFDSTSANYSVEIGKKAFENKNAWNWSDTAISQLAVPLMQLPKNQTTVYRVQVKIADKYSNPINYQVEPLVGLPHIDRVDPVSGPAGSYVTVYGSNFGTDASSGKVKFNNNEADKNNWANAIQPIAACSDYWQDNRIIIKVPAGLTAGNTDITVMVNKSGANVFADNEMPFSVCNANNNSCPLRPGICGIKDAADASLTQAPINFKGLKIVGEYFGNYSATTSKVSFFQADVAGDLASVWGSSSIGGQLNSQIIIPVKAATGPLRLVRSDEIVSNSYPFTVADCRDNNDICSSPNICCPKDGVCRLTADCASATQPVSPSCTYTWNFSTGTMADLYGAPQVIKDIDCTNDTQSPSPYMDSASNCKNALISARFNQAMNPLTLVDSNIVVRPCNIGETFDGICTDPIIGSSLIDKIPYGQDRQDDIVGFIFYPNTSLISGRWYEVTLKSGAAGIKSVSGIWLDGDYQNGAGGDFVWHFRVQDSDEECKLAKVIVQPNQAKIALQNDFQNYLASALAENCNILDGRVYNWDWYKLYTGINTREDGNAITGASPTFVRGTAIISEKDVAPTDGKTDYKQVATPNPPNQGLLYVGAEAEGKNDDNNQLIVDLNIPVIDYIYPDNGLLHPDVNAYVTIYGRNFGATQSSSLVSFDKIPANLADCITAWSDTMIQVKVPKGQKIPVFGDATMTQPATGLSDGMILYYNFEESDKVLARDTLGDNNAEITDGLKENGQFGKALKFNGTSTFASFLKPGALSLPTGSIELWFKPEAITSLSQTLFSFSDGTSNNVFSLELKRYISPVDSSVGFQMTKTVDGAMEIYSTANQVIPKNSWNHLVYTYDGEKYLLYINGVKYYPVSTNSLVSRTNISDTGFFLDISRTNILLGAKDIGVKANYFQGLLDNLVIYNRVISEEEVRQRFGLGTGQLLLLNFDETGSTITDSSPNNFSNLQINDPTKIFRTDNGQYGRALSLNNDNYVAISRNSGLVFTNGLTIEGWFKVANPNVQNTIYSSGGINLAITNCGGVQGLCLQLNLADEANASATTYYKVLPAAYIKANDWNYFAAVFDGSYINIYLNSEKVSYPNVGDPNPLIGRRILQVSDFGSAKIGGTNQFSGQLDQIAIYNQALPENVVFSRIGARDGSHLIVKTTYGEATSRETFKYSQNVYPFLCSLNPYYGVKGTSVSVAGDNFGDSNKTVFAGKSYGVGSYLKINLNEQIEIVKSNLTGWANKLLGYTNQKGIEEFSGQASYKVFVTIDPQSDPYNDKISDGLYTPCFAGQTPGVDCDEFADPDLPANGYDEGSYNVGKSCSNDPNKGCQNNGDCLGGTCSVTNTIPELKSNELDFYLPPYIYSISPDNGPKQQWVTIKGINFGDNPGTVVFYNGEDALPSPCKSYWTNNRIIVLVPDNAQSGDVYVVTERGIRSSNSKNFTVNDKPLGPGLCDVYRYDSYISSGGTSFVHDGKVGDYVIAEGDRFDEEQNDSTLLFTPKVKARIGIPAASSILDSWTNTKIVGQIEVGAESGDVIVTKKMEVGKRCVGFKIRSFCPGGEETLYEEIPSNPVQFALSERCDKGRFTQAATRDPGFNPPLGTWVYDTSGNKVEYGDVNTGVRQGINTQILATDGTYLYSSAKTWSSYQKDTFGSWYYYTDANSDGLPENDNIRTIWKIGTGYNNTEVGRVYTKYQFNWKAQPDVNLQMPLRWAGWYYGWDYMIGPINGNFYVSWVYHDVQAGTPYCGASYCIPKVVFLGDGTFNSLTGINEGTYTWDWVPLPQGLITRNNADYVELNAKKQYVENFYQLAYNGENIFVVSYDLPGGTAIPDLKGYTIQVLDKNWQQLKIVTVPNTTYSGTNIFTANSDFGLFADKNYLYTRQGGFWRTIDLETFNWIDYWYSCTTRTMEYSGLYDPYHNKYWFGNYTPTIGNALEYTTHPDFKGCVAPTDNLKLNRIYRYSACPESDKGACQSDADCTRGSLNCQSQCVNNYCTPWIKDFTPINPLTNTHYGPVGTWVNLRGCWFGCQPGNVYFTGTKSGDTNLALPGNIARYQFEDPAPANFDGNGRFNGVLQNGAKIENGVLVLDGNQPGAGGDILNLNPAPVNRTTGLWDPNVFRPAGGGNPTMTITVWVNPTVLNAGARADGIIGRIGGVYSLYVSNNKYVYALVMQLDPVDKVYKWVYANSGVALEANKWTHIAFVLQTGKGYKFYINGKLTKLAENLPGLFMVSAFFDSGIGVAYDANHNVFNGKIDDVGIYNRELTQEEIIKLSGSVVKGNLADCENNWICAGASDQYDQVTVEVPNRATEPNMDCPTGNCPPAGYDPNDAIDGPISLFNVSGAGTNTLPVIFDVNNDPLGPQICGITPEIGKRGTTIKIIGQNFNTDPSVGEMVYFGPGANSDNALQAKEPWFDVIGGTAEYDGADPLQGVVAEQFIDFNVPGATADIYDSTLDNSHFDFPISQFVADSSSACPANGWSENNVCFKVPKAGLNLVSDSGANFDAGGQGTGLGNALNSVNIFKDNVLYGGQTFRVTFGVCGDNQKDVELQEECDGNDLSITTEDAKAACWALFPAGCSLPAYLTEPLCTQAGGTWTNNDYDEVVTNCTYQCSSCRLNFCYHGVCRTLDTLCGNGNTDTVTTLYSENCDCGNNSKSCVWPGVSCPANYYGKVKCTNCKYDNSNCQTGPMPEALQVETTIPHEKCSDPSYLTKQTCQAAGKAWSMEEGFCRNGIIDVFFDKLVDISSLRYVDQTNVTNTKNVLLARCTIQQVTQNSKQGMLKEIAKYFKNIFNKLLGLDRRALAQVGCSDPSNWQLVPETDYFYTIVNLNNKTKLSIIPNGHLEPATIYAVIVKGGETGLRTYLGGLLDNTNSPFIPNPSTVTIGGLTYDLSESYNFSFKTLGQNDPVTGFLDPNSGICNVDWIDVTVYRDKYVLPTNLTLRPASYRNDDLFVCAKDNCLLDTDYDQDITSKGNQHIYQAIGKHFGGFSLKATYKWSRSDASDPNRVLTINNKLKTCTAGDINLINQPCITADDCTSAVSCQNSVCVAGDPDKLGDACSTADDCAGACTQVTESVSDQDPDPNIVKNQNGLVYTTPAQVSEAVGQLVIDAQAEGSSVVAQNKFLVYLLLCENPWPSLTEKFPIDSLIDAYNFELYYCRDAGQPGDTSDDLPAANWLFPDTSKLNILKNTNFEFGSLTNWTVVGGGTAFTSQPVFGDITRLRDLVSSQIQGKWWISTRENFHNYDWETQPAPGQVPGLGLEAKGILHSQGFLIEGDKLKFRIGGGSTTWPNGVSVFSDLTNPAISNVTAVVLGIKADPGADFTVVNSATGSNNVAMKEMSFNISQYKSGRSCVNDAGCGGFGTCKDLEGAACGDLTNEKCQCTPVTGIIYLYDNSTINYLSFDDLRQYTLDNAGKEIEIPFRF